MEVIQFVAITEQFLGPGCFLRATDHGEIRGGDQLYVTRATDHGGHRGCDPNRCGADCVTMKDLVMTTIVLSETLLNVAIVGEWSAVAASSMFFTRVCRAR